MLSRESSLIEEPQHYLKKKEARLQAFILNGIMLKVITNANIVEGDIVAVTSPLYNLSAMRLNQKGRWQVSLNPNKSLEDGNVGANQNYLRCSIGI